MSPTALEDAVIRLLLDGEGPTLEQLRRQYEAATITKREHTGSGVHTTFQVPAELRVTFKELQLEGVRAEIAGLTRSAGFILFVTNGVLDVLEAYTNDEVWPSDIGAFTLSHTDAVRGDVEPRT